MGGYGAGLPRPCPLPPPRPPPTMPPRARPSPLSRSIANRPEQESRSACSTRPDRPFACKHLQKTTETWLSRLNGPSRSPPASPRLGPSNNKHAPRIRKRDQRRARILRWASSRFVELDPDSDVDVGAASLGMANAAVRAAAQARDPIALASKRAAAIATAIAGTASSTVGAALAAALAPYQAPATATAVTCRGTATSTVGAARPSRSLSRLPRIRPRSVTVTMSCNGR